MSAPPAESKPPLPVTLACASAEREAGVPPDLIAFRAREGKVAREKKLRELWELLPLKDSVRAAPGPNPETGGWVGNSIFGPSVYRPPPPAAASDGATSTVRLATTPRQTVQGARGSSATAGGKSSSSDDSAALFSAINPPPRPSSPATLSPERADALRAMYQEELVRRCANPHAPDARQFAGEVRSPEDAVGKGKEKVVDWKGFRTYLWEREAELWKAFVDLDRDHDGVLGMDEMQAALRQADITLTPATLQDFVSFLASNSSSARGRVTSGITWLEFRDMFLLLPRSASVPEIYRFYQVRKAYSDGRGAARLNSDGDVSPSYPSPPTPTSKASATDLQSRRSEASSNLSSTSVGGSDSVEEEEEEEEEADGNGLSGMVALKFLGAGGIAGAVSRTATAPFDRLKVFLITDTGHPSQSAAESSAKGAGLAKIRAAIVRLYSGGGGLRAFWVGNGLNVLKIMPESAIKFFSYETSKRMLARYWDHVDDPTQISGSSRFLAGGLGGITSQFAIYPLETLKTAHMTTAGKDHSRKVLLRTAANMWAQGGVKRYYRGLTLGLVGVFPYAAIDMSTFETLKLSYCEHFHLEEPDTMAVLTFGAISGGVGATSVYPINVVRTRLQAAGSTGHPQEYSGFLDVVKQTYTREGWRGFYKGLTVNLAKVIPAVSISYVVYENSKKSFGL